MTATNFSTENLFSGSDLTGDIEGSRVPMLLCDGLQGWGGLVH